MKKLLLLMTLAIIAMACDREEPCFEVVVKLNNAQGRMIYLQKAMGLETITLDSVMMDDSVVVFKTPLADNDMYSLLVKGWRRPVDFFSDNANVVISGDYQNARAITIDASESQNYINDVVAQCGRFDNNMRLYVQLMQEAKDANDMLTVDSMQACYDNELKEKSLYLFNELMDNNFNEGRPAHYLLNRYKYEFQFSEIKQILSSFVSPTPSSNKERLKAYVSKLERVQVGQPILDFTQNDANGNPVTLSELAAGAPLLLVDFWASWCPDCRVENPNIVAVYNEFKELGLQILGVSLDNDKDAWLAAIDSDELTWSHVSDLKGWSNAASTMYAISFIPQNVLIKDGMIIGRNLTGDDLRRAVEDALRY